MSRPKRYEDLPVDDIDLKGHGVVHGDGYVLFIDGALPGDRVDAAVRRRRSGHAKCRLLAVRSTGIERIAPRCVHFEECGGCSWQNIPYARQLELKQRMVAQAFARYAPAVVKGPCFGPEPILGCLDVYYYRNRLDYSFSARRWITREEVAAGVEIETGGALGFHAPGRFDKVVPIERCHLQGEPTNEIRNAVAAFTRENDYPYYDPVTHEGLLRNLVVRTTLLGEVMLVVVFAYDDRKRTSDLLDFVRRRFSRVTSLYYMINPTRNDDLSPHEAVHVAGARSIRERCGPLTLEIDPKSFYQTNSAQAERLYRIIGEWANLRGGETVLDLYCGIGSIALFLAGACRRATGLEVVPEAIKAARRNARANGIGNVEFVTGAAEEALPGWDRPGGVPDLVVVDPPRAGLHPRVVEALARMLPDRIIYVSCNPASQATDVATLGAHYRVARQRPVDLFPHTRHVENIVELVSRAGFADRPAAAEP